MNPHDHLPLPVASAHKGFLLVLPIACPLPSGHLPSHHRYAMENLELESIMAGISIPICKLKVLAHQQKTLKIYNGDRLFMIITKRGSQTWEGSMHTSHQLH